MDLGGAGGEYDKNAVHKNFEELTNFLNGRIKATTIYIMCIYVCSAWI